MISIMNSGIFPKSVGKPGNNHSNNLLPNTIAAAMINKTKGVVSPPVLTLEMTQIAIIAISNSTPSPPKITSVR